MRLLVAVLLCGLVVPQAWTGEAGERVVNFDIRAQALPGALLQFSAQSGIQVLAPDAGLAERRVRALRGQYPVTSALTRLLVGTGFSYRQVDDDTIALVLAAAPAAGRSTTADAPQRSAVAGLALDREVNPLPAEVEEVQVTGTRIRALDSAHHAAPNPTVTITGAELRQLGIVNVADALTTLVSQNVSSYQPALTGDMPTYTGNDTGNIGGAGSGNQLFDRGSFFIGNAIANLRGLDPMFGSRTLTLIDGRRVVSTSNQAEVVDLNIIPSNLLQRMDIVTGGASATYGSGAMAGVVNLVLDSRLNGVNLDLDYGINEAGDGASPHVALSGGMPLFGNRAHVLAGVEWQRQSAIRDCAAARDWCADSRALLANSAGSLSDAADVLEPLSGYEDYPARFRTTNIRYSQFAPSGAIYVNAPARTSGYRFSEDGTSVEEYAFGYRGASSAVAVPNGDGPPATSGTTLRPRTRRTSLFGSFEYNFDGRTTGYVQASYAGTATTNRNPYTISNACVRFHTTGTAAIPAGSAVAGTVVLFGGNGEAFTDPFNGGMPVPDFPRDPLWSNANFRAFLGVPFGRIPPFYIPPGQYGSTSTTPPTYNFQNAANAQWQRITSSQGTAYWNLVSITLGADFEDPGSPAVLPMLGRNAYAFLNQLGPEALYQVQRAFGNSPMTGGGNSALGALYGASPCAGSTAIRKAWYPQIQQWTTQDSQTWRAVAGVRGRFGRDWRWDAYYQYGTTGSTSRQNNVPTNLSFAFAMDAVIDDRVGSPTFGQPVCRIIRDGVPLLDTTSLPLSDPEGLEQLASGCRPLNIFGSTFADPAAAERQREALDYAFRENTSDGATRLHTISFTSSGPLWKGWGAGPLTGAFGFELSQNSVDNQGSRGPFYLRADIARAWGDAFGGRTRSTEGYTELNLPLVSGMPGINLWSLNLGARHTVYFNEGGAGTTGASATQGTFNWKVSTVFEPFDWVRLRLTRSRDLRAAGYRELFLLQPALPDQANGINYWRERTEESDENQRERWGFVRVGNPDLRPEKSDTLTLGMVLSPGGWAQGMRFSADYYTIRVKDGIYTPFNFTDPILSCWENSGNVAAQYLNGAVDPANPGINGLIDDDLAECRELAFAPLLDEQGHPIPGSRDLQDIVSFNAVRPANSLPYKRRGVDLSWSYRFALQRLAEGLPGSVSLMLRATRALESSGVQQTCGTFTTVNSTLQCTDSFREVDLAGQIRSSVFIPGVSAVPTWTGNIIGSYQAGDMLLGLSARYVGAASLDRTWCDSPDCQNFQDMQGRYLNGSIDDNRVKPYLNFSLNGSYDLQVPGLRQFQVFGSINNLFDRDPPFTGGGISGASAQYHDTMGRSWRMGVRMRF